MSKKRKSKKANLSKTTIASGLQTGSKTVILDQTDSQKGPNLTVKTPHIARRRGFAAGIAHTFIPQRFRKPKPIGNAALNPIQDRKASRRLKKMAKNVAKGKNAGRSRRSRLPLLILLLIGGIGYGSYWAFDKVSLPDMKQISSFVDYESWFANVSGKEKSKKSNLSSKRSKKSYSKNRRPKTYSGKTVVRSGSKSKKRYKTKPKRRVVRSYTHASKTLTRGKYTKSRKLRSKSAAAKRAEWKRQRAKLERAGKRKYRRASSKYKKSN